MRNTFVDSQIIIYNYSYNIFFIYVLRDVYMNKAIIEF